MNSAESIIKGFEYFTDIEDKELRIRNTAVFATNLFEDHFDRQQDDLTERGKMLLILYWNKVDASIRTEVFEKFKQFMKERGFSKDV